MKITMALPASTKSVLKWALMPVQHVDYFVKYHNLSHRIWLDRTRVVRSPRLRHTVRLLQLTMLVNGLHLLYLGLWPSETRLAKVLHCDGLRITFSKSRLNLISVLSCCMVLYYNTHLLIRPRNYPFVRLLYSVAVQQRWQCFFLGPRIDATLVCDSVRRCLLTAIHVFICVLITFEANLVIVYLYSIQYLVWHELSFDPITWLKFPLYVAIFHTTFALFCVYMLNMMHSIAINFTLTVSLLRMFQLRMGQVMRNFPGSSVVRINSRFRRFKGNPDAMGDAQQRWQYLRYARHWAHFTRTLSFFLAINRVHGKLFCAFLVDFVPVSLLFTIWVVGNTLPSTESKAIVVLWLVYIMNLLFVFHCLFAQCPKLIHRPSKWLFALMLHNSTCKGVGEGVAETTTTTSSVISLRGRLRLAHSIAVLHTDNRYGFTYGDFGLVSLNTFAKFVLLYGKFCLISFKLMRLIDY